MTNYFLLEITIRRWPGTQAPGCPSTGNICDATRDSNSLVMCTKNLHTTHVLHNIIRVLICKNRPVGKGRVSVAASSCPEKRGTRSCFVAYANRVWRDPRLTRKRSLIMNVKKKKMKWKKIVPRAVYIIVYIIRDYLVNTVKEILS